MKINNCDDSNLYYSELVSWNALIEGESELRVLIALELVEYIFNIVFMQQYREKEIEEG